MTLFGLSCLVNLNRPVNITGLSQEIGQQIQERMDCPAVSMLFFVMLSSFSPILAQSGNPMMTTCDAVRTTFLDNSCCRATLGNPIPVPSACPTLDELVTFPKQMGNVRRAAVPGGRSPPTPAPPPPRRPAHMRCSPAASPLLIHPARAPSAVDAVPDRGVLHDVLREQPHGA